ncbi:MAG: VWA domain-containing protein [Bacteroides sp.]|nr:VWA domain-containing protein [Eubacterium sp.]MCM1418113.1 VWA domain-containing protein [Roseburia sp.]MCM1462263.1 VWA domain-containing protein [Bacteroides sp.]
MKRKYCAILAALLTLSSCAASEPIVLDAPPSETTETSAAPEVSGTGGSEKPSETTSAKPEATSPVTSESETAETATSATTKAETAETTPAASATSPKKETTTEAVTTTKPITTTKPVTTALETYEDGGSGGLLNKDDSLLAFPSAVAEAEDYSAAPMGDAVAGESSFGYRTEAVDGAYSDEASSDLYDGGDGDDDFVYDYDPAYDYDYDYVYPEQSPAARAGLLTGGEWRDSDNFDFWKNLIGQRSEWNELSRKWRLSTVDRVAVRVLSDGKPAENVTVKLFADETVLWEAVTDNRGNAYLYKTLDEKYPAPTRITAERDGKRLAFAEYREGESCTLTLSEDVPRAKGLDLMFVIDTTGSMGDELRYLQAELEGVIGRIAKEKQVSARLGLTFYRDEGDEYTVRGCNFTDDIPRAVEIMNAQSADGGGDYPEAVEKALARAINDQSWGDESVKLLFLVLDAPPHDTDENAETLRALLAEAAKKGIRIIPVASSGVDTETEFLCRSFALATGGTYTFLTDHSGIGLSHLEPTIGSYQVEKLNDLLARIIEGYLAH